MNITEYLVTYLKEGNSVEIPNVGTFIMKEVVAHYDEATSTFYPTRRTVNLDNTSGGFNRFIKYIAEKECVNSNIATQMWKNYYNALNDKLKKDGVVVLGDLGSILCNEGKFTFQDYDGLNLKDSVAHFAPISGVNKTNKPLHDDPFAIFENKEMVVEEPEENNILDETTQTENTAITDDDNSQEDSTDTVEVEENTVIPDEPKKEEAQEENNIADNQQEEITSNNEPTVEEPQTDEEPKDGEKAAMEEESENEDSTQPEQQSAAESAFGQETEPDEPTGDTGNTDTIDTLKQLDAIEESDGDAFGFEESKNNKNKKKCKWWKTIIRILLILIILLACAFVIDHYLFSSKGRNWVAKQLNITALEVSNPAYTQKSSDSDTRSAQTGKTHGSTTENTFSLDGLRFTSDDIANCRDKIMSNLDGYFTKFLKDHKQLKNKEDFYSTLREYTDNRLSELLIDNSFNANELLTYEDYVRDNAMPMLKNMQMSRKRAIVQAELMDKTNLANLLVKAIPTAETNSVSAGGNPAKKQTNAGKAKQDTPIRSHVATSSKQGFDIIAGFYVNKSSADRLCSSLKAKGCDAYIIDKNGLYYVSMGSASSRTEAEARFYHIKEWYKEDISIKQW